MSGSRGWFHPKITGIEAEKLLKKTGAEGSFLVRHSKSGRGSFTLSIRSNGSVNNIKIENHGEYYDLEGGDKFATLGEMVQFYINGYIPTRDGDIIKLRYPLYSADPTTERWFHGQITSRDSDQILEVSSEGSFLIRGSTSKPGEFVLSVMTKTKPTHLRIYSRSGKYDVGGSERFSSLADLVDNYRINPLMTGTDEVLILTQPINITRIKALEIENRVTELEKKECGKDAAKHGFWEEFEKLRQYENKYLTGPVRTEGQRPENKAKNRYKNILPCDDTRVHLQDGNPNDEFFDYINANHIKNTEAKDKDGPYTTYIATQGCLRQTISDFWQMVWQEKCRIIVMTTGLHERGKNKCAKYWPDSKDGPQVIERNSKKLVIKAVNEVNTSNFILREFELYEEGQENLERKIYQYHFTAWPDHGVPDDPACVLDFLEQINARQESWIKGGEEPHPILVHCSAGIGRTGAFIVIDIILKEIKKHGINCEIDIQKTIQMVRLQRSGMVQTEDQYKFVYIAIMHHIDTLKQRLQAEQQSLKVYSNITDSADGGGPDADNILGPSLQKTKSARRAPPTPDKGEIYQNVDFGRQTRPATTNRPAPPPIPHRSQ